MNLYHDYAAVKRMDLELGLNGSSWQECKPVAVVNAATLILL